MIAPHADLVGMTIASECVIAGELGLEYAALCMVDNLANGLAEGELSVAEIEADRLIQRGQAARRHRRACCRGSAWSAGEHALRHRRPLRRRARRAALSPPTGRSPRSAPRSRRSTARRSLDAAGAILVPPLVNGHTHAAMTLFRGSGGDLPLMPWLRGTDLADRGEARARGRLLGHAARLPRVHPLRHDPLLGHVLAPRGDRPRRRRRRAAGDDRRAASSTKAATRGRSAPRRRESLAMLEGLGGPIRAALAPHAIYTVSEESLRFLAELSAERDAPVQIHLSETGARGRGLHRRDTACAPPSTSTASACSPSAPCSPTASGSTKTSWR